MRLDTYKHLLKCQFVSNYRGFIEHYSSNERRELYHNFHDINEMLSKDYETPITIKNCIILFPVSTGLGDNPFITVKDKSKIVIDHITYIIDVRNYLHEKGIVYKNGISMINEKYSQLPIPMLIIQDGIAYAASTANVTDTLSHHISDFATEIKIDSNDNNKIRINDKEIFFSGFVVDRIRKNNL